ncbi:uncharacterized protein LAESUDRAFT_742943 [Laetiporus sulphureus 93-53]|uniref:Glycopeptide n=1 Tax=Laetiporus sulphureus 93-53 TaxID=1314785 RepID=A0A165EQH9_9APHY|nr:uncharacterized protein LAESUDRAFT_742943 [Laetiporus sulphureus 93-53]KZT07553.1 hypothetical protein LAESUDRAFT_742943 [Laetiporus sulphureus 93-53]
MFSKLTVAFLAVAMALVQVNAETHTVTFNNKCGRGTPYLRAQNGQVLSTGGAYTISGPLIGAIAYLQTGGCGNNGEDCTLIETTLKNGYSSTDVSLIPPHEFNVAAGFGYYDGCDGKGADCTSADCTTAFHTSDQTWVQVGCAVDNENLVITFCD